MKIKGIVWMGVMSEKFSELAHFYENIFGLSPVTDRAGFKAYKLENGDTIEIFDRRFESHSHFNIGPVVGFLVDDIQAAKKEMEAKGIEFIGDIDGDPERSLWAHFRAPDGNVYELKYVNK